MVGEVSFAPPWAGLAGKGSQRGVWANFPFEEKSAGDVGEENILMNRVPAKRLYSDRTHTYIASSGRCWPAWEWKILIDVYGRRLLPRRRWI